MAVYEYQCDKKHSVYLNMSILEEQPKTQICVMCKTEMKRVFSAPATQFIGSGFYSTDKKK